MAFYRTAPVSAITHCARVTGRHEERHPDAADGGTAGAITDADDWAALIEPFSDERVAVVFALGDLVALETPVENDASGVRGAWYPAFGDLRAARSLSELAERMDE